MRTSMQTVLGVVGLVVVTQAAAQITLYESEGFRGRDFTTDRTVWNFDQFGFNDRASSAVVSGGRWEACEHAHLEGRCVVLEPGSYNSLAQMGISNAISSVRPLGGEGLSVYRPRTGERLYQADVTSVRAVVGPPEQRCWIERERVVESGGPNVPGAIVGGIVGGILGHQIGSGRGRDVATAGGAVAGAAIGANVGRDGPAYDRDVQRCTSVPSASRVEYWGVTYYFAGREHYAQLNSPPGRTITVNEFGEPRA